MAVSIPQSRREVALKIFADIEALLPDFDPTQKNNLVNAIATGQAGRIFDAYVKIKLLQDEFFLQTATDLTFIRRWGYLKNVDVKPAGVAYGNVTFTGTVGALVPLGSLLVSAAGNQYQVVNGSYEVKSIAFNVVSLTSDGFGIVTVVCAVEHNYTNNLSITISGAVPADYNGTYTVLSVIDEKTFTYAKSILAGTATGTITCTSVLANAEVQSVLTGLSQNLDSGARLNTVSNIPNINSNCYAQYFGISGGADVETNQAYKGRVLNAWRNPIALWNVAFIESVVLSVPGVTRVWVYGTTPDIGEVTILFVRDNDPDIIPNPNEITDVKNELLKYRPADRAIPLIHVNAPVRFPVNFVFTSLFPDSQNMRLAIEASLLQFFRERVDVGKNVTQDSYRCAIQQTVNPETGDPVQSFTLSLPIGDISVASNQLPDLGTVSWI